MDSGPRRIAQKGGEEAVEVAIAAVSQSHDDVANEMGDLLFHCMVLLASLNLPADQVWQVLADRRH